MSTFVLEPLTPAATARAELIVDNLPLVKWLAARIHRRLPQTVALEDLVSIGVIGLIQAIDRFDASLGVEFRTFAEHRIRGSILDSVAELDGVPAHKRSKAKRFKQAIATVEQREGRAPTAEEVAAELGVSLDEYHEWSNDVRGVSVGSLTAEINSDTGGLTLAETIVDPDTVAPIDVLQREELDEIVRQGMTVLPAIEQTIVKLYFKDGLCLREIADMLSLHITRVSHLKTHATQRLRRYVEARWRVRNGGAVA